MKINELVEKAHATSRAKGWYDKGERNIPELLCLIHSEVSEALEAYRTDYRTDIPNEATDRRWHDGPPRIDGAKPEGFASEIADVFIRLGDLCGYLGIDAEKAIAEKMAYNERRSHRHGGKVA